MRTSERRRLLREQLQRDAEIMMKAARDAIAAGELRMGLDDRYLSNDALRLKDALRNVNRSATRALDVAGVPDAFQGAGPEDWDMDENEARFWK